MVLTGFTLNGIGSKIVILHGLFGSSRNWRSIAQKLSQTTGRTVQAIDLPNHGANERTDKVLSCDQVISSVKETIGDERYVVIGHSMV
jgi:esterase